MTPHRLTAMARRTRLPPRTLRLRLSALYGALFLISGTGLLAITNALARGWPWPGVSAGLLVPVPGQSPDENGTSPAQLTAIKCIRAEAAQVTHQQLNQLLAGSAVALGIMAVASIVLGWVVAGRLLRPLREMTDAARQISEDNLGGRLAVPGPGDELKDLGDTIDGLLARLEASFRAQRQFIANASHELRTPLTRQRVISQVALADPGATIESLRTAHERVLASGAQQQQLIDALLTLARGQAGLDDREPFDLAAVTSHVLAARQPEAAYQNLMLQAALGPAPAAGSPGLVERLAANLVDNALRYNVPGGRVDIITGTRDGRAFLSLANTGPPVPAAALDRLFRPFQRLGTERTSRGDGVGLGLSIVQAIANAHHATISARPQPEGGLLVEVTFPDPDPHAADPGPGSARSPRTQMCQPPRLS